MHFGWLERLFGGGMRFKCWMYTIWACGWVCDNVEQGETRDGVSMRVIDPRSKSKTAGIVGSFPNAA